MNRSVCITLVATLLTVASPASAWGDLGHEVTARIAYRHLTPSVRTRVDALLASDTDTLTAPDFASRATWADKFRNSHRETAPWHFVDIEIDRPDLTSACFGFPSVPTRQTASQGPSQDCVVDKIEQFTAELQSPGTLPAERLQALKFLIHFVGDLHQPLHASDHNDRGGNCIALQPPPSGQARNLHAYWDTGVVEALGASAQDIAAKLDREITPAQAKAWSGGDARSWAMESFQLGRRDAYKLPAQPSCNEHDSVALSTAYQAMAQGDAAVQLEKAGIRMAFLLNRALR